MKKVNTKVQILATLTIPSSIYAFKRIDKLRKGIILNVISLAFSYVGVSILSLELITLKARSMIFNGTIMFGLDYALFMICLSIVVPMYFIDKWSDTWNMKADLITK